MMNGYLNFKSNQYPIIYIIYKKWLMYSWILVLEVKPLKELCLNYMMTSCLRLLPISDNSVLDVST